MNISQIADNFAVASQIFPDDVTVLAAQGFVTIICNRPDGEDPGQPSAAEIATACDAAGLAFHHIPVSGMPVAIETIHEQRRLINDSNGLVLAYCRSGQRSQFIWSATA
jgi:sulfide:quinone oxidoreductase